VPKTTNPKRVLVVEDERPMAHALELKLNHSGYEAMAVFNGQEALDELNRQTYDLIILDLVMPVMDGFALLRELQTRGKKIPVIVASNLSQEEDAKKAKKLGAKDYFVKSNTPIAEVINHVKKILP
jgi:DNA-binding response OmpR family regulator